MSEHSVNILIDTFNSLAEEEKSILAEKDNAWKEYNDYCSASDSDLSEKLAKLRKKIASMEEYMRYAAEHTSELEEATEAFESTESTLVSLQQSIGLDSHNDPSAESLYTKASAQKLFYEQEINRERTRIEGSKHQAQHQYDTESAALEKRKSDHDTQLKDFMESDELKGYLKELSFDVSAFNSMGIHQLEDTEKISIGQLRIRLPVPEEFVQEFGVATNGMFNSATKTIGEPYAVSTVTGSVLYIDFDDRNETFLLGGIQRLLLNEIKYFGDKMKSIYFCEPIKYSTDCLGHIDSLAKGINPFMTFPTSPEAAKQSLCDIMQEMDGRAHGCVDRVFVFHSFPEAYDDELKKRVIELCRNAEQSGSLVVLTHMLQDGAEPTEEETEIRALASYIRSRNGGFYINKASLFWYSAPSGIPDEIRRVYVEQRRQAAIAANAAPAQTPAPAAPVQTAVPASTVTAQTAPVQTAVTAPTVAAQAAPVQTVSEAASEPHSADNAASRTLPAFAVGTDVSGGRVMLTPQSGTVTYICGKACADTSAILRNAAAELVRGCHPDNAELWLIDCADGTLLDLKRSHVRYNISGNAGAVCGIIDRLFEELCARKGHRIGNDSENGYMPQILVIVNGFDEMLRYVKSAPKYFGVNYDRIIRTLFERGGAYGIHFLLAGNAADITAVCGTISEAVIVGGCSARAAELFASSSDSALFTSVPLHSALVGTASQSGFSWTSVRLDCPNVDFAEERYSPSERFNPESTDEYLDKKALFLDRRELCGFNADSVLKSELCAQKEQNEILLFLGAPCCLAEEHPVRLNDDFAQNVLVIASAKERLAAASAVLSVLDSLREQGRPAEIITSKSNPVYDVLKASDLLGGLEVRAGADAVSRISELSAAVESGSSEGGSAIVLGADELLAELKINGAAAAFATALANGARYGQHFFVVGAGAAAVARAVPLDLFRHRAVFSVPVSDAGLLLNDTEVELPLHALRLSDSEGEVTLMTYTHDEIRIH